MNNPGPMSSPQHRNARLPRAEHPPAGRRAGAILIAGQLTQARGRVSGRPPIFSTARKEAPSRPSGNARSPGKGADARNAFCSPTREALTAVLAVPAAFVVGVFVMLLFMGPSVLR